VVHKVDCGWKEQKNTYKILFGKLERKRARARPRHRWKDCFSVMQCENAFWINVRVVPGSCG
jgi:hypothetical protein